MTQWSSHICKALQKIEDCPIDSIPEYDDNAIKETEELIKLIQQAIEDTDESQQHRSIILNLYMKRLQDGILLYNRARLNRIVDISFRTVGSISPEVRKMLTPSEMEFLDSYKKSLAKYIKSVKIDPTEPFRPPQGLNAEVKVLRDVGSIMVGDNYHLLKQNDILTLRASDAQELEQHGFVKITAYLK